MDIERCEIPPEGLYRALTRALVFDVSWLLLTPQSMISGYVYPNVRVDQAVAELHKCPSSSERKGDRAVIVSEDMEVD